MNFRVVRKMPDDGSQPRSLRPANEPRQHLDAPARWQIVRQSIALLRNARWSVHLKVVHPSRPPWYPSQRSCRPWSVRRSNHNEPNALSVAVPNQPNHGGMSRPFHGLLSRPRPSVCQCWRVRPRFRIRRPLRRRVPRLQFHRRNPLWLLHLRSWKFLRTLWNRPRSRSQPWSPLRRSYPQPSLPKAKSPMSPKDWAPPLLPRSAGRRVPTNPAST